jgi:hypothetical protein
MARKALFDHRPGMTPSRAPAASGGPASRFFWHEILPGVRGQEAPGARRRSRG